jgi:hypothetical protein
MKKLLTAAALGGLLATAGANVHAGTIRHDRDVVPYLELGSQFPTVGSIYVTIDLGPDLQGSQTLASAVLIAPNWVLTAAHVTDALEEGSGFFTGIGFIPAQDPHTGSPLLTPPGSPYYEVADWVSHPGWAAAKEAYLAAHPGDDAGAVQAQLMAGYDIALVQLADPVTDTVPITRYGGSGELGQTGIYAGYGMRGTGQSGVVTSDELRRAGHNTIDLFGGSFPFGTFSDRVLFSDFDDPGNVSTTNSMGSELPLDLEYSIAGGDSGGPVYVDFPDDGLGPVLVGINSFNGAFGPGDPFAGDNDPNSQYDEFFGATRVSPFNDWINATAGIPEPGSLAGAGLLAAALLGRRRRRRRI